jgi:hypothetical protein
MRFVLLRPAALAACGLALAVCAGCGWDASYGRYKPSEATSRQALEAALEAWQSGKPPDEVGGSPIVQVVDSAWRNGQRISGYQILREEPEDGLTFFSVRLTPKGKGTEKVVRYVVVGRDPLWVYREDDYKTSAGM